MNIARITFIFLLGAMLLPLVPAHAQEEPSTNFLSGTVVEIVSTSYPIVFGREIEFQELRAQDSDGTIFSNIFNDYTPVSVGEQIYFSQGYDPDTGVEGYFVTEIERMKGMYIILAIFVVTYLLVAGFKGVRSLVALGIAVLSVWFILLPLIIAGYNALYVGLLVSMAILGVAIFITHGLTIVSVASYCGSVIAIFFTLGFATFAVHLTRITGLVGDESSTIGLLYGSAIDLQGLILATMIIGILGVLDDVAIMQAAMVREFMYERTHSFKQIFVKSMRVGREHAAALVNTLVLAYTAVALPLFLIVLAPLNQEYARDLPLTFHLSNELFIIEFVRSVVGSFGLVITIPIVTALALLLFNKYPPTEPGSHHHHH